MNRAEAYGLLTTLMKEYVPLAAGEETGVLIETIRAGDSGTSYTLTVSVEEDSVTARTLKGVIRSNNPHKYEMLEEKMLIPGESN